MMRRHGQLAGGFVERPVADKGRRYNWNSYFEQSRIHSLRDIAASAPHSRARAFHYSIFAVACVVCLYVCYFSISYYRGKPVATSFLVKKTDTLLLPDITVCPFNRLDKTFLTANNISWELSNYIEHAFFFVNPIYEYMPKGDTLVDRVYSIQGEVRRLENAMRSVVHSMNHTMESFLDAASLKCSDVIVRCVFMLTVLDCCATAEPVWSSFGKCYRIKGVKQQAAGYDNGLTIHIALPYEKYSLAENNLHADGILMKLAEPGKGFEFDATFIPPHRHALLELTATRLDFMNNKPHYTCVENPPPHYAPLPCYESCVLEPTTTYCQCRHIGSPPAPESSTEGRLLPVCTPGQIFTCIYLRMGQNATATQQQIKRCKAKCRTRCSFWQYEVTVSYAAYPSQRVHEQKYDKERRGETIVEIFYDRLEYKHIIHFPSMTFDQAISNIGGSVSLFVGGSMLSLVHLITFMVMSMLYRSRKSAVKLTRAVSQRRKMGQMQKGRMKKRTTIDCESTAYAVIENTHAMSNRRRSAQPRLMGEAQ